MGSLLLANIVWAQYPYYHNLTTEEGLPSNEVYSIIQDKHGFIWIGSDVGLIRYNGVSFKLYKNKAQRSRIMAGLTISNSSRIYGYNFSDQVFYFENDSLYELEGLKSRVTNIAAGPDGRLWVSGPEGVDVYNEQLGSWEPNDTNISAPTRGICLDEKGAVWYLDLKSMKVARMGNGHIEQYEVNHNRGDDFNLALHLISVGKLGGWLVPINGGEVYKFDGQAFVPFLSKTLNGILKGRKSNQILQMPDGRLWFCTYSGVVVYNPSDDSTELLYDGVSFSDVMLGREGGMWLTSLHEGLFYIPDMRFLHWGANFEALQSGNITQLDIQNGQLYYATSDGYFGLMNLVDKHVQNHYLGLRGDINGLYFDTLTQTLLLNSTIDIYGFADGSLKKISTKAPPIKSILRAGKQLYYTASFGLYVSNNSISDEGTQKLYTIWCRDLLYQQDADRLWVASDSGVLVLNATGRTMERTILPDKQIVSLAAGKEHIYSLLFSGEIKAIGKDFNTTTIALLPNDANGADLEIVDNKIWVATNQGLWIYDIGTKEWMHLDKVLGLASNSVKVLKQYNHEMWLATGNGIQTIPLDYNYNKCTSRVYLSLLTVNGKLHNANTPIRLSYNDVLGFVPEAAAYSSMAKFQYAYRTLQGDTTWQLLPANTSQFSLLGISPGNFTLQLKVIDHTGRDSENIISIKGYMQPPFWQRWWFYVLLSVAGLFMGFIGFRYRLRIIKQKQQQQLERVQLENELELSQQAALKAQMNPHFIFNVLNSIKSYIYENDKKSAAEYLSTFAKLIRRILSMSSEANVSLEEELEALELYIQLEAMLLEPPFSYSIDIDKEIEPSSIRLPSLLLQPYVENAFKHGLRHQHGEKQLLVSIRQLSETALEVTVDDNGVGREMAAQLNKDRMPGHQSFATTANSKRLELLNQNRADSVNVVYIDKKDDDGKPSGTRVVITIKVA